MAQLDRPYLSLAMAYARAGQLKRATDLLRDFEAIDLGIRRSSQDSLDRARGVIALADGRAEEAIELFRRSDKGPCPICVLPHLGQAYDRAGMSDSTTAIYERYVTTPWFNRLSLDASYLGRPIYERLATLYEERDDTTKAIEYYAKLVDLWKDADPELQPRVEAARRAIKALSSDQ